MQTKYDHSSNPYAQPDAELEPVAESELPPAVKTGSLVALIAVLLGTVFGSLLASPDPAEIARQQEAAEVTTTKLSPESASTSFESSTPAVTSPVTIPDSSTTATAPATEPSPSIALTPDLTNSATATPSVDTTVEPIEPEATAALTTTPASSEIETTTIDTPTSSDTTDSALMPEIEATTSETTTAVSPSPLTTTAPSEMAAATATSADPAQLEELNQTIYQTIDQAWTTTPVTGESVYRVKVAQDGTIVEFEPKSQIASENLDNTPLSELVSSDDVTATPSFAEFDVIFQPSGLLEVNTAQ